MNRKFFPVLTFVFTGILCFQVHGDEKTRTSKPKMRIVTTTGMIMDTARIVGGDRVEVTSLMGPGIDPHRYEPTAGDVSLLEKADLIFYNGLHLEGQMGEVFHKMGSKGVAVTDSIERSRLLRVENIEGNYDPHVWFDVDLWSETVKHARDTLIERDAEGAEYYRANAEKYLAELKKLHNEVLEKAKELPPEKRILVTAHDAFNYFGRAYGFQVHGLQGVSTESEAGVGDVDGLARLVVDNQVPAIFVETSVNERNMRAVQRAIRARGFQVKIARDEKFQLFSDAMGNAGTPEESYPGMVRHNINTIVTVLQHPEVLSDQEDSSAGWSRTALAVMSVIVLLGLGLLFVNMKKPRSSCGASC